MDNNNYENNDYDENVTICCTNCGDVGCAAWCIYMGADGASIRRELPSKVQEQTRNIVRKIGASGIITMLWRSLIAFQSMTDKCIIPAYKECFKHGAKENTSFNQMQSAFELLKKSA